MRTNEPKEGRFPTVTYTYKPPAGDEPGELGRHVVTCGCGASCETTEELAARNFVQHHAGHHARHRIVTPRTADDA